MRISKRLLAVNVDSGRRTRFAVFVEKHAILELIATAHLSKPRTIHVFGVGERAVSGVVIGGVMVAPRAVFEISAPGGGGIGVVPIRVGGVGGGEIVVLVPIHVGGVGVAPIGRVLLQVGIGVLEVHVGVGVVAFLVMMIVILEKVPEAILVAAQIGKLAHGGALVIFFISVCKNGVTGSGALE